MAALATSLALSTLAGCSRDAQGNSPALAAAATKHEDSAAAGRAGAGSAGGRRQSIALSPTDVMTVARGTIEEAIAVTGNLRPIENAEVRARADGDIDGVFAREGQHVRAGELLARIESSQQESALRSAQAAQAAAKNDLATAEWNLQQSQELFKAGAIAEQEVRLAQSTADAGRAKLAAADAMVRSASQALQDTRVTSPTTGTVDTRSVENGEHVAKGQPLFTVVRNDVLELAAAVPARQASVVRPDQVVHFNADGQKLDGRVARVSPTVDPTSRSVAVYVRVPNPNSAIKGGTFTTGRIVSRTVANTLVIPSAAVRQSQESGAPFVYRIDGTTLNTAPVQLGIADEGDGTVQVLSGLAAGDRIVVGNVGTLGRGMQVEVVGGARTQ